MNSTERVRNVIQGKPADRQPIYGWVSANLEKEIRDVWGSVAAFEDKYEFDMAHLFGGPDTFKGDVLDRVRAKNEEMTPDLLTEEDIFDSPDRTADYRGLEEALRFHKERGRFCYVQTPGFFEQFNSVFGIENQLLYLAMYPEELEELYRRQADWTIRFAGHCIDLGIDMIHISDDWGAQKDLMFNPSLWREIIYPNMKRVVDYVRQERLDVKVMIGGAVITPEYAREIGADGYSKDAADAVRVAKELLGMQ